MDAYNPIPGIESYKPNMNPTLRSPYAVYELPFYQTKESLQDIDTYRNFIKNVEHSFRGLKMYTGYKSFLHSLGFDHCQVHGYINTQMAKIEMHHAIMTLFDLSLLITEWFLNTVGYVTTYDVVNKLREEHSHNNVALVMLTETPHQLYHNDSSFYIHPSMCIGKWPTLIEKYKAGLTQDLAFKLLYYIKKSIELGETEIGELLDLEETIRKWEAGC